MHFVGETSKREKPFSFSSMYKKTECGCFVESSVHAPYVLFSTQRREREREKYIPKMNSIISIPIDIVYLQHFFSSPFFMAETHFSPPVRRNQYFLLKTNDVYMSEVGNVRVRVFFLLTYLLENRNFQYELDQIKWKGRY